MGSGPLDQMVGLAIVCVPDSLAFAPFVFTAELWKKHEGYG
jgi:hypothetical protein